jgi:hypothetical protein
MKSIPLRVHKAGRDRLGDESTEDAEGKVDEINEEPGNNSQDSGTSSPTRGKREKNPSLPSKQKKSEI